MSCGVYLILPEVYCSALVSLQLRLAIFRTLSNFFLFFFRFLWILILFHKVFTSASPFTALCLYSRGTSCYSAVLLVTVWNRAGPRADTCRIQTDLKPCWGRGQWTGPTKAEGPAFLFETIQFHLCFVSLCLFKKYNSCVLEPSVRKVYVGIHVTETARPCGFHVNRSRQQVQTAAVQLLLPRLLTSFTVALVFSGSFSTIHLWLSLESLEIIW